MTTNEVPTNVQGNKAAPDPKKVMAFVRRRKRESEAAWNPLEVSSTASR